MKKYKYFNLNDSTKETIGIVNAESINEAYSKACSRKELPLKDFKSLFKIEKL